MKYMVLDARYLAEHMLGFLGVSLLSSLKAQVFALEASIQYLLWIGINLVVLNQLNN